MPGTSSSSDRTRGPVVVVADHAHEHDPHAEPGQADGDVGRAPQPLDLAGDVDDRDRGLGREPGRRAVDVAVEHDVADDHDADRCRAGEQLGSHAVDGGPESWGGRSGRSRSGADAVEERGGRPLGDHRAAVDAATAGPSTAAASGRSSRSYSLPLTWTSGRRRSSSVVGRSSSRATTRSTERSPASTAARWSKGTTGRAGPLARATEASVLHRTIEVVGLAPGLVEGGDVALVEHVEAAVGGGDAVAGGAPAGDPRHGIVDRAGHGAVRRRQRGIEDGVDARRTAGATRGGGPPAPPGCGRAPPPAPSRRGRDPARRCRRWSGRPRWLPRRRGRGGGRRRRRRRRARRARWAIVRWW